MNYNTDVGLWKNEQVARSGMPNGGSILRVFDGMISDGYQVLARFNDSASAESCLKDAGFKFLCRSAEFTDWKAR